MKNKHVAVSAIALALLGLLAAPAAAAASTVTLEAEGECTGQWNDDDKTCIGVWDYGTGGYCIGVYVQTLDLCIGVPVPPICCNELTAVQTSERSALAQK